MKKTIFREYDIRGIYPQEVNDNDAYIIGRSYGSILQEKYNAHVCIVGQDNRISSPKLAENLIKGLLDSGTDVIDLGVCTTPMFSYAVLKTKTIYGIMVTASHNPKDYNGFKVTFDDLGFARGNQIYDFRDYTFKASFLNGHGKKTNFNIYPYYKSYIESAVDMGPRKLKVVIDPGNGTTSLFVRDIHNLFDNLDIEIINEISDSTFPNHHPDPNVAENLKMLQEKVIDVKADIGVAYDGDGDRVGIVNDKGEIVTTEQLMILIIRNIINQCDNKSFLYDIKCSKVLKEEIIKLGGNPIEYRTGASYTRYKTNLENLTFGGEYSGHLYFRDRWLGFDSGIYNGLRIIEILSKSNIALSQMLNDIKHYVTTPEIKVKVDDVKKFDIVNNVKEDYQALGYEYSDIDGIKVLYDKGWVMLRASNTTPNLEIRIEAEDKEEQNKINNHFMSILQKYLVNINQN